MTPEEILARAADRVEQGWCQGALFRQGENGIQFCLVGALICGEDFLTYNLNQVEASAAIAKEIGTDIGSLVLWNNNPSRCKEEVVSTIRNAKRWL